VEALENGNSSQLIQQADDIARNNCLVKFINPRVNQTLDSLVGTNHRGAIVWLLERETEAVWIRFVTVSHDTTRVNPPIISPSGSNVTINTIAFV
jgi:hypothetical protein